MHCVQKPKRPARLCASLFVIEDARGSNLSLTFSPSLFQTTGPLKISLKWPVPNLNRGYLPSSGTHVSLQGLQHTSHFLPFLSNQHDNINVVNKCGIQRYVQAVGISVPYYD